MIHERSTLRQKSRLIHHHHAPRNLRETVKRRFNPPHCLKSPTPVQQAGTSLRRNKKSGQKFYRTAETRDSFHFERYLESSLFQRVLNLHNAPSSIQPKTEGTKKTVPLQETRKRKLAQSSKFKTPRGKHLTDLLTKPTHQATIL